MTDNFTGGVLAAMLALIAWSFVMVGWLYATRIPAMYKHRIRPQSVRFRGTTDVFPDQARQVADNYNHLMEQPTLFYALGAITVLAGQQSPLTVGLAWTYVALRVAHSLIQATINRVILRFYVFSASTLVLVVWLVALAVGLAT
jgi:hypothetical protein